MTSRALVLLGFVVLLPDLAAAGSSRASTLAGTTVVAGSRSAWMSVRLPRAATLDVYAGIQLSGPGRLIAIALKQEGLWDAPTVFAVREGFCATAGCTPVWPRSKYAFMATPDSQDGLSGRLPAGNYRLYLVTDGGPARAVLRLRGLAGQAIVEPKIPIAGVQAPRPTEARPADGPLLFAGGSTHRVPSRGGLNFTVVWKEEPVANEPNAHGLCIYDGTPPPGDTTAAYQMPCRGGQGDALPGNASNHDAGAATTPVGPGRYVSLIEAAWLLPAGTFSHGGYLNTAGPVTTAHVHQLWLDY